MVDSGQMMERFRHLSRDIQIGLQTSFKHLESLKSKVEDPSDLKKINTALNQIKDAWDSYYGWVLLSSLDDEEEASANCAPGYIDLRSKVARAKNVRQNSLTQKGLKVDLNEVQYSIQIQTYIPYFEQLLDLILDNAIKYSLRGGTIEFSTISDGNHVKLMIHSIGPSLVKHEVERLGQKGFRSENAKKMEISGQGYGLYNVKRIADLIHAQVSFNPEIKILCHSDGIPQSNFTVKLTLPESL
ncbi:sensor histidine kinase [Acinetobacter guillouiae]|uniref:sensor histidine kinase n=1 Tax=Acinetobacter guillouiae TaxID=106649 RepID=UPI001AEACF17|nr:ATP-binding protein [Acinetobacter guillouiae]MBP2544640.1 signal transduction histidine kinase [Acinetobacter guillouiae]